MSLSKITASEANRLIASGAVLIDIRSRDEHAREYIPGARNQPIDTLRTTGVEDRAVIFHCKSGSRTTANLAKLSAASTSDAYVLEGGIEAWRRAGLPIERDARQPIELNRQVQIAAGSLVLLGVGLSQIIAPEFLGLAAFIGAGLVFAGVTGWCGMAKFFSVMPWNRRGAATKI
jgi:rhodanese-related sulfurtransferase